MAVLIRSEVPMERKIISISSKRQVTIPQKYFESLGFSQEAECIMKDGGIFIRPVHIEGNEFSEEILADLISEGYSGETLLAKFKEYRRGIRPAVESMIAEADRIAKEGASVSLDSLFGSEGK